MIYIPYQFFATVFHPIRLLASPLAILQYDSGSVESAQSLFPQLHLPGYFQNNFPYILKAEATIFTYLLLLYYYMQYDTIMFIIIRICSSMN